MSVFLVRFNYGTRRFLELLARFELAATASGGLRVLLKQASPVSSPVRKAIL